MRWLKHMTASRDDEVMALLIEEFGPGGYGVWWIVLEMIGSQLQSGAEVAEVGYPIRKWAQNCGTSAKNFQKIAEFLEKHGKFTLKKEGGLLRISCPNLLKYKDEWSCRKRPQLGSDSGVTREPSLDLDLDLDQRQREEKKPPLSPSETSPPLGENDDRKPDGPRKDQAKDRRLAQFSRIQAEYPEHRAHVQETTARNAYLTLAAQAKDQGFASDEDLCCCLITRIREWSGSDDWSKDGGKYVPGLGKWLKDSYWRTSPHRARDNPLVQLSETGQRTAMNLGRALKTLETAVNDQQRTRDRQDATPPVRELQC